MRGLLRLFAILAVLTSIGLTASAQDDDSITGSGNIAEMLRFVPDNDTARRSISYGDYRAAAAGRQLEVVPQDFADFESMANEDVSFWIWAQPRGGIQLNTFQSFGEMPNAMGIDFFHVEQSLEWGVPPDRGFVLQGDFDEASVRAAHESRGFVESELDGAPLWCHPDGCDQGSMTDLTDRQMADVFGGDLGRKFPRVLTGDFFISAAADTSLEQMTDAGIAGGASLADDPAYMAAVAALGGDHYLRAVQFAPASDFLDFDLSRLAPGASEEDLRELVNRLRGGEENLPPYNLAVFADIVDAEKEYAMIALVYRDEELATFAADILTERLSAAESAMVRRPWAEIIADRDGTIEEPTVFHAEEADRWVTLFMISKPLPPNEPVDGRIVESGLLYRLLIDGYFARDLGWLQPVILN